MDLLHRGILLTLCHHDDISNTVGALARVRALAKARINDMAVAGAMTKAMQSNKAYDQLPKSLKLGAVIVASFLLWEPALVLISLALLFREFRKGLELRLICIQFVFT